MEPLTLWALFFLLLAWIRQAALRDLESPTDHHGAQPRCDAVVQPPSTDGGFAVSGGNDHP